MLPRLGYDDPAQAVRAALAAQLAAEAREDPP
jgi:hypothetical protein